MVRSRERVEGEREEMISSSRSYSSGGGGSGSCSNNVGTEPDKRDESDGTAEFVLGRLLLVLFRPDWISPLDCHRGPVNVVIVSLGRR